MKLSQSQFTYLPNLNMYKLTGRFDLFDTILAWDHEEPGPRLILTSLVFSTAVFCVITEKKHCMRTQRTAVKQTDTIHASGLFNFDL